MPNWIEGTLKLRGKQEDMRRFFREGLQPSNWPKPEDRVGQIIDRSAENELYFEFNREPHIVGTRRAFITDESAHMSEESGVVCVNVKQAWAFYSGSESNDLKAWKGISDKYNVDIKLYGIERGMEFTQEIIILRGEKPIVNERQYEDWDWDCPFPNMGG